MKNPKLKEGLEICVKVSKYLKNNNVNDIMKLEKNTIVMFKSKSRLCDNKSMSIDYAHFHNTKPHRVCIKQKILINRELLRTGKTRNDFTRVMLNGNYALSELIAHELAHHKTKGHGNKFHIKYNKFMSQLSLYFISGDFYKCA